MSPICSKMVIFYVHSHSNGISQINTRPLQFRACSNKRMRIKWQNIFFFFKGGYPLNARSSLSSKCPVVLEKMFEIVDGRTTDRRWMDDGATGIQIAPS